MNRFSSFLSRLAKDDSGAPAIEYAMLAAVIALTAAIGMGTLGNGISTFFGNIGSDLQSRTVPGGTGGTGG
ncbi:Flp family type IVb pilin [Magnetospirillum sp. UT-4]|uniref:Flp family type IVb pilin n=1 Tax=Magnetospirillum sp. UT-4 TaxID=2681467 RepID=UPI0013837B2B|nr:Flp family type IVb pilin [Magnetospirillum sp. UT-4]CAA7615398.1 Flp/Fap pilin component (modular protein) [Magnetospirillum sp. UT-4]